MKKSVEEILFEEQRINKYDLLNKEKFITKTSKYFKEIMNELYQIDYEAIEEYMELISDKDLIKLLQEEKRKELSPALIDLENNIKLASNIHEGDKNNNIKEYKYRNNHKIFSSYSSLNKLNQMNNNNVLNNNSNSNTKENLLKRINITRNANKFNNYQKLRTQNSYRISSINKNNENSIPKKNNDPTNFFNSSNLDSTKHLNEIDVNNKNNKNQKLYKALSRHSEINCMKYLQKLSTYNELGVKRRNDSNNISNDNNKSISIENNDDIIDIINTLENKNENKTIKIESPIKIEKHNEYNYEKLKKMNGYKKKIFNLNDSLEKNKENSTLLNDNTKLLNTINTEEKFDNKNIENVNEYKTKKVKPYYRKVIKNTINNDTNNNYINIKN